MRLTERTQAIVHRCAQDGLDEDNGTTDVLHGILDKSRLEYPVFTIEEVEYLILDLTLQSRTAMGSYRTILRDLIDDLNAERQGLLEGFYQEVPTWSTYYQSEKS